MGFRGRPARPHLALAGRPRRARSARLEGPCRWLVDFGWFWGAAFDVFAAQAVAVAFEAEDLGVVDEPVDHGGSGDDRALAYLNGTLTSPGRRR